MEIIKDTENKSKETVTTDETAATEKFDSFRSMLETKKYDLKLNKEETNFLFDEFYNNIQWQGYEAFPISKTHEELVKLLKNGKIEGEISPELLEAIFHFIKIFSGTGLNSAEGFVNMSNAFAKPMAALNEDRQELQDRALELEATKSGLSVEEYMKRITDASMSQEQMMQQIQKGQKPQMKVDSLN